MNKSGCASNRQMEYRASENPQQLLPVHEVKKSLSTTEWPMQY